MMGIWMFMGSMFFLFSKVYVSFFWLVTVLVRIIFSTSKPRESVRVFFSSTVVVRRKSVAFWIL